MIISWGDVIKSTIASSRIDTPNEDNMIRHWKIAELEILCTRAFGIGFSEVLDKFMQKCYPLFGHYIFKDEHFLTTTELYDIETWMSQHMYKASYVPEDKSGDWYLDLHTNLKIDI